jgi:hypothetical protein
LEKNEKLERFENSAGYEYFERYERFEYFERYERFDGIPVAVERVGLFGCPHRARATARTPPPPPR